MQLLWNLHGLFALLRHPVLLPEERYCFHRAP